MGIFDSLSCPPLGSIVPGTRAPHGHPVARCKLQDTLSAMRLIVVAVHRPCPSKIHAHLINEQRLYLGCSSSEAAEPPAAPSQAPQGPSTSSPGSQHKLHNEGCQQTIGECLIRHSPILVDAIMLFLLPLLSTLLASFYSPSVSHQPPPVRSRHAPSQRGPPPRIAPQNHAPGLPPRINPQDHHPG